MWLIGNGYVDGEAIQARVCLCLPFLLTASAPGLAQWNGEIVARGRNHYRQCNVPYPNTGFVMVASGVNHSLGLQGDGTSVEDDDPPWNFLQIHSVSPNPFSTSTSVVFNSPGLLGVTLKVYGTTGRLVRTQEFGNPQAGQQSITWDGRDRQGVEMATGVYFIRLRSDSQQAFAKIVLVR